MCLSTGNPKIGDRDCQVYGLSIIGHDMIMAMNILLSDIKVLIWDFDGTLYKNDPRLLESIRERELEVIQKHTGWSRKKAEVEFYSLYPKSSPSGTKVVSMLSHIPLKDAARECAENKLYDNYLHPDKHLHDLFLKLSSYTHYLLVNGGRTSVLRGLKLLSLNSNIFKELITSEDMGVSKPDTKGFEYIMAKTGLAPHEHLMIGDRELVDLAPAKMLGMRTCLVWTTSVSAVADATVRTVYEIADIVKTKS